MNMELKLMVEEQDGLREASHMIMNLEETHMIMRENMNRKLDNYLDPLVEVPSPEKYY